MHCPSPASGWHVCEELKNKNKKINQSIKVKESKSVLQSTKGDTCCVPRSLVSKCDEKLAAG